jgi:hypothetical protein
MIRTPLYFLLLVPCAAMTLCATACGDPTITGGDTDTCSADCDDNADPLSALPGDTLISDLSKQELIAFCERRQAFFSEFLLLQTDPALVCTEQGLDLRFQEGLDIPACEAERTACIEEAQSLPAATFDMLGCLPYQVSSTTMAECTWSLDAFDVCTGALLGKAEALISTLTCNISIEEAARFRARDNTDLPAECDPVVTLCPPLWAELDADADAEAE